MNSFDSTNRSQLEIKESEEMSRYLDQRVVDIEKYFTSLTTELVGYARRTAKLRNNGDKIVDILNEYVKNQQFNSSTHGCINEFCNTMYVIGDLRTVELDRIKDHVLRPMMEYTSCLKNLKVELKKDSAARKKELASYKKLNKSHNGSSVDEAKARVSIQSAVLNATKQSDRLLKTVTHFEKTKLEHVPTVLKSFIHIEMLWHMRALERYTEAYRTINNIDCQADLDEFLDDLRNFRSHEHLSRSNSNLNLAGRRSQSMTNLKTTNTSSHGDLSAGRNELRTSVTFEDQHQRSRSFQQPSRDSASGVTGPTLMKPPVASGPRPAPTPGPKVASSDESEYTDSEEYTDDGTTTASRTASARSTNRAGNHPGPQKRVH